jgi:hypothetical protein
LAYIKNLKNLKRSKFFKNQKIKLDFITNKIKNKCNPNDNYWEIKSINNYLFDSKFPFFPDEANI